MTISLFFVKSHAFAAQCTDATVINPKGAKSYTVVDAHAKLFGTYPQGRSISINPTPKQSYYLVCVKLPEKSKQSVWIPMRDLQLKGTSVNRSLASTGPIRSLASLGRMTPKRWTIEPGIGYTSLQFKQTTLANTYQMNALTGQITLKWQPKPTSPLEFEADAITALVPVSQSLKGISAQYLRVNAKGGVGFDLGPVRLDLLLGACLNSLNVTNNAFGYSPVLLFGIYPKVTYSLGSRFTLMAQARYFPTLGSSFSGFELDWNVGVGLRTTINQRIALSYSSSLFTYGNLASSGFNLQTSGAELGYQFSW